MKKVYFIILMLAFTASLFPQSENFNTSIHKTRNGKKYWYAADTSQTHSPKPGFETFTGIAIDTLGCIQCHGATDASGNAYPSDYSQGTCSDCHDGTPGAGNVTDTQCFSCHGRQGFEKKVYSDVHRTAGMMCWDCHTTTDMHGDGTEYNSFLEAGALSADCEDCHVDGNLAGAPVYDHTDVDPHNGELHCTACHSESVISCYNCHFNSKSEGHVKRAYTKIKDFVILVNREKDGKVGTASFQSLTYDLPGGGDSTWVAFAPYTPHTTMQKGRTCSDCHASQNVNDYFANGQLDFAKWNSTDTTLTTLTGVVPFPYDYETSFKMDYLTYTGDLHAPAGPSKEWHAIGEDTWDGHQLFFATPLDTDQMYMLSLDFGKVWANFDSSQHKTRFGKQFWYGKEYGGFETLTDVPIEDMGCRECHGATNADGDPYDEDYSRGDCSDCHGTNTLNGDAAAMQTQCLSCHSRQATEIGWINSGLLENVHGDSLTCKDCHMPNEDLNVPGLAAFDDMHSLGHDQSQSYASMLSEGAMNANCENCHDASTHSTSSNPHGEKLSCEACHASTVVTCYNCHLDSQVSNHIKRAYTKAKDFVILANRTKDGKVYPMSFQALTYQDSLSWVAFGPFSPHSIMKNGRSCSDCHENMGGSIPAIEEYNANHTITFGKWNDDTTLTTMKGIIPMPVDYETQFKMDFLTYTGDQSAAPGPSKEWKSNGKNTWDGHQMMFATPLTTAQMAALGFDTTYVSITPEEEPNIVSRFELKQNYPNPFNPTTTIEFSLPHTARITMVVFDVLGKEIAKIYDNKVVKTGTHKVDFDASKLASGIYFYQIRGENFARTRKMFLLK